MTILGKLPADVRRAVARKELRRRGALIAPAALGAENWRAVLKHAQTEDLRALHRICSCATDPGGAPCAGLSAADHAECLAVLDRTIAKMTGTGGAGAGQPGPGVAEPADLEAANRLRTAVAATATRG